MNDRDWISVNDRLPNAEEEVWVYTYSESTFIAWYWWDTKLDRARWTKITTDRYIYDVRYWMPMNKPEPPIKDDK